MGSFSVCVWVCVCTDSVFYKKKIVFLPDCGSSQAQTTSKLWRSASGLTINTYVVVSLQILYVCTLLQHQHGRSFQILKVKNEHNFENEIKRLIISFLFLKLSTEFTAYNVISCKGSKREDIIEIPKKKEEKKKRSAYRKKKHIFSRIKLSINKNRDCNTLKHLKSRENNNFWYKYSLMLIRQFGAGIGSLLCFLLLILELLYR